MDNERQRLLEIYLKEYEKLKEEQAARIGFRDNLLYVTLGVFGGVLSFVLVNKAYYYGLLVLPWVCLVLGWTYLVNDEKITALGKYIRRTLTERIREQIGSGDLEPIFGWEIAHRDDDRRKRRKIEQLFIDEITFVVSGAIGVLAFWLLVPQSHWTLQALCWIELGLLAILGIEIIVYADLAKGR